MKEVTGMARQTKRQQDQQLAAIAVMKPKVTKKGDKRAY